MSIDYGKLGAVAGLVAAVLAAIAIGVPLLAARQPQGGLARAIMILSGVIAVAVVAVMAIFYLGLPASNDARANEPSHGSGQDRNSVPSSSVPSSSVPPSSSTPPPPLPHDGMAALEVSAVCACPGLPGEQGQVTIRLSLRNISDVPISAALGNIRILVPGAMPGAWRPVNPAAPLSTVTTKNQTFIAFSPNGNADPGNAQDRSLSHWYADVLMPGEVYPADGGDDVTFYVPDPGGANPGRWRRACDE